MSVLNPKSTLSNSYKIHNGVEAYVLEKLKSHDIVFLGTTHKKPAVLKFIADLIPHLKDAGVTHVGIEMPTDHQGGLNSYLNTGTGLTNIYVHPQIDCPEYRDLLKILYKHKSSVVALDLPKSMYKGNISRDEWMAQTIANVFSGNPDTKMLLVVGIFHVFKRIEWQDHVPNKNKRIRGYSTRRFAHFCGYIIISLPITIKRSRQTISNFYKQKALFAVTRSFFDKTCSHYAIKLTDKHLICQFNLVLEF